MMTLHDHLARAWANWNGQTGTPKQVAKIQKQLDVPTLQRMLGERGVTLREEGNHIVMEMTRTTARHLHTCDQPGSDPQGCLACKGAQ